ncbi:MAG: hypothetical protein Q9214_006825 [Letrouitia sp. 1 TL-2023]
MTDTDAFEIQLVLAELEFPFTFEKALQFALFRTYGIPSISKLLVSTAQFSSAATASKRYTDTVVLIREFVSFKPAAERSLEAISRMNYIHSVYQNAGKISNDDMLYTLSLFAAEPVRWIARYEWRALEDFERCALGTYWKSLGDAMGISYEPLRSSGKGWVDGLEWLEDMMAWSETYEKASMVPHEDNRTTADQTIAILLWEVPSALKGFGKNLVSALMDDRLRVAMMYDRPSKFHFVFLSIALTARKIFLRYFSLPRPFWFRARDVSDHLSEHKTFYQPKYDGAPYYVKPTLWSRWGPRACIDRLMGLPVPGDEGPKYHPEGYKILEVGPELMQGKGAESMREAVKRLRKRRTGACPFTRIKAE